MPLSPSFIVFYDCRIKGEFAISESRNYTTSMINLVIGFVEQENYFYTLLLVFNDASHSDGPLLIYLTNILDFDNSIKLNKFI